MWREDRGGVSRVWSPLLFLFGLLAGTVAIGPLPEDNTQVGKLACL